MYENNRENREYLIEEEGTREALPEPSAEVLSSDRIPDTDDEITAEELLNHCTCHIVEGHMQWRCDGEVYRDRLADLLKKEPVIELEANSSLAE